MQLALLSFIPQTSTRALVLDAVDALGSGFFHVQGGALVRNYLPDEKIAVHALLRGRRSSSNL